MLLARYRPYARPLISTFIVLFLLFISRVFDGTPLEIAMNLAASLSYSALPIIPRSWWNAGRLLTVTAVLGAETAVSAAVFHELDMIYMFAIWLLSVSVRVSLARAPLPLARVPLPLIAVLFLAAALYMRFGNGDLTNIASFVALSVVFYFFLRSNIQRREIFEANKQNLAELQDAYLQLQEASASVMRNAVLEERTRIAGAIHDAVGHSLTSLIVQMQALRYRIRQDPEDAARSLEEMLAVARQGLQDIRTSVHALAGDLSLPGIAALRTLLSRAEASASLDCSFDTNLTDGEIGVRAFETLFRILQEAVTNIIRHSHAKRVEVRLTGERETLRLSIRDDGVARPEQQIGEGFGLRMMRKRLEELGGTLRVTALAPHGLEIVAEIPLSEPQEED